MQVLYLGGDCKKQSWGKGRMRQRRGHINIEVHIIRFAAMSNGGSVLQGPSRK